jgi:hypothetical protein
MISVVVTLCHLVTVDPQSTPITACFERVAGKNEISISACGLLMPGIADWKEKSRYASEDYFIATIRCVEGDYQSKDEL